jgi:hypothetical protein
VKTEHEATEDLPLSAAVAVWVAPLGALLQKSLRHMPPEKRSAFAERAMQELGEVLSNLVAALSKDASECSDAAWDKIKDAWLQLRNDYRARANRLKLQNAAKSMSPSTPEMFEALFQASALVSEKGEEEDWRALEGCKKFVAAVPEARKILEAASTSREEAEIGRSAAAPLRFPDRFLDSVIRPAINFYILTELGDALFALLGRRVQHEDGVFVPVLHRGRPGWEGVLDVSFDGEYIAWYEIPIEEQREAGLEIAIVHRDTGQRRGVLRLEPERNHMDWQPDSSPADR